MEARGEKQEKGKSERGRERGKDEWRERERERKRESERGNGKGRELGKNGERRSQGNGARVPWRTHRKAFRPIKRMQKSC